MENIKKIKELTATLSRVETNLTQEKEILEFILENTTDGYWDWNMETNYEYLSPKFKAQLGYTPDEMENTPESWQAICNKEDLYETIKAVESHIKGETDSFKSKLRFTHLNGHEVNILCRGKIVSRNEDGSPIRMIGTHTIIN